jgi:hypothetical protein
VVPPGGARPPTSILFDEQTVENLALAAAMTLSS